ncbi:MAG: endoglucanase [Actinobacteria bacterium]|nr:endoglucanase [Actinomycetota bacterium]
MARRTSLLIILAAIVTAVVALTVVDPFASSPGRSPEVHPSPAAPQVSTTANPAAAPTAPAEGAYLGAWVGPVGASAFTQAYEINAVYSLQQQLGRKLRIVHTYLKWQAPFPTPSDKAFLNQGSMLLISWAGTDAKQIISGAADGWIRTRAHQIMALDRPVFLEWRWEMDRPNLRSQMHSGAGFVAAWDRIRAIFASVGVHNAAWVWCPTAKGFADGQAAAFYPGNQEVDWVCADAYPVYGTYQSFASTVDPFLSWASHHGKPVMIGEFGVPEAYGEPQRAQWLRAAQQVVLADRQIKALVYFDASPSGRGNFWLGHAAALTEFRSIASQPYFNPAGSP